MRGYGEFVHLTSTWDSTNQELTLDYSTQQIISVQPKESNKNKKVESIQGNQQSGKPCDIGYRYHIQMQPELVSPVLQNMPR